MREVKLPLAIIIQLSTLTLFRQPSPHYQLLSVLPFSYQIATPSRSCPWAAFLSPPSASFCQKLPSLLVLQRVSLSVSV